MPERGALTVVTGENGAGKTSLLEAIAYLSTQQSFRASPKESIVRVGTDRSVIRAEIAESSHSALVEIEIVPGRRDQVFKNRQRVNRVQQLLETLKVTIFAPDDLILIKGGPAERRRYLDDVLVASRPLLVTTVQSVDRILRQRGVLLKQAAGKRTAAIEATLDVWDSQLAAAGDDLVGARETLVNELSPHAEESFRHLTRQSAALQLSYRRSFSESLIDALRNARAEDLRRGITTVGPHRDDLYLEADGLDARTKLSQGRQRAATLALRLASHRVTAERTGTDPVLLLDDAFSELDDATANALFDELPPGQAILTTAGILPERARSRRTLTICEGVLSL